MKRFAEGQAEKDELETVYDDARALGYGTLSEDAPGARQRTAACMAGDAAQPKAFSAAFDMTAYPVPLAGCYGIWEQERDSVLCQLLRCIIGSPFRSLTLTPTHRTPTVVSLARAAYDERHLPSGELEPHRLPVLADALEETGGVEKILFAWDVAHPSPCRVEVLP